MITEPSIPISRIKQVLDVDVALGKIPKELAEQLKSSLMFDWEIEKWQEQQTKEGCIKLLAELFEHYDVQIGTNNGLRSEFELRFGHFGYATFEHSELNAELVRLFPKQHKRVKMFYKVLDLADEDISKRPHIDTLRPILAATKRLVGINKVTDKEYKQMLDELKAHILKLKQQ